MSSSYGKNITLTLFGESHGAEIGAILDNLPPGESIDLEQLDAHMSRRRPGYDTTSSSRKESDRARIVSGVSGGKTTGAPLCILIPNLDVNSEYYWDRARYPRPSHVDYTACIRYKNCNDIRGGGHLSGRLTAPLTFAGAICLQILAKKNIRILSHVYSINSHNDTEIDWLSIPEKQLQDFVKSRGFAFDTRCEELMRSAIVWAKEAGDSLGGTIECAALNLPAGIGSPIFGNLESCLSSMIFAIPAVKGIEFGAGFSFSDMKGSEANDSFQICEGRVTTRTNHSGGIQGGISNGMPIVFRVAVKPTPSVGLPQKTVDLAYMQETELSIHGRHDPCIAPRMLPVIESAAAIALLDMMMEIYF